jgi:hypothetical protein
VAKTISEGFTTFLSWLTPTTGETSAAKSHRTSIEACLKANFNMSRFFRAGSFGHGTSIRGYSDVDYFASIPPEYLRSNSSSMLHDVWEALDARFPTTIVATRTPAVLVPFGTSPSESHDIVPAKLVDVFEDQFVYGIADGSGGWMKSSPEAHNDYVAEVDKKLKGRVKPLIRYVKAWRCYKSVPIYSFYLEIAVTKYAAEESTILYTIDIEFLLKRLLNNALSAIRDPLGISGNIQPCFSEAKKDEALSKMGRAVTRVEKAREAETKGNIEDAFYWWNLFYNDEFPAYY